MNNKVTGMESSQPLSIESFSYSWLVNIKPSFESLEESCRPSFDASDEASFIEMDPKLPPSKRFFRVSQDFSFDFPTSQPPLTLVHADELISNGFLVPLFIKPLNMEAYDASYSVPSSPFASFDLKNVVANSKARCSSLRRCRRLSKQIVQKYLNFLTPLCQRIRWRRSGSRAGNIDARMQEVKNWEYISAATSPQTSAGYSTDNWHKSCDSEGSIYEAVLHCKKTIGK